jgi:hypothetical protein
MLLQQLAVLLAATRLCCSACNLCIQPHPRLAALLTSSHFWGAAALHRYFMLLPANKLELWLALESERFQVPVLRYVKMTAVWQ